MYEVRRNRHGVEPVGVFRSCACGVERAGDERVGRGERIGCAERDGVGRWFGIGISDRGRTGRWKGDRGRGKRVGRRDGERERRG